MQRVLYSGSCVQKWLYLLPSVTAKKVYVTDTYYIVKIVFIVSLLFC